jgi:PhzF family phenazine biosynthesis protein
MQLDIYQIDAFTGHLFAGNPAAVCLLERWLPETTLQAIAQENNLSETAFIVQEEEGWRIRWFTPVTEVALCGHATLASAWVYFHHLRPDARQVVFESRSGPLRVDLDTDLLTLDFPLRRPAPVIAPGLLAAALGAAPVEVLASDDWLVRLENEAVLRELRPDMELLRKLERRCVIATAEGSDCDFVSRCFAPKYGIDEDPVTGSAHTTLTPYWAEKYGRQRLHARQLSARGGELFCELRGDRVGIGGHAVPYLKGVITL